jgi:hypothetical protein
MQQAYQELSLLYLMANKIPESAADADTEALPEATKTQSSQSPGSATLAKPSVRTLFSVFTAAVQLLCLQKFDS